MDIITNVLTNELFYKNTMVMGYSIKYPQFSDRHNSLIARRLSRYYYESALETAKACESELFQQASKLYDDTLELGITFNAHELNIEFTVTQNDVCVLSLFFDEWRYMGGANGELKRVADNWNLVRGRRIQLSALYPDTGDYMHLIVDEVVRQISAEPYNYFPNYTELAAEHFDTLNFYLKPGVLVIFYQEVTIAPHVAGIPEFDIPYAKGPVKPVCDVEFLG